MNLKSEITQLIEKEVEKQVAARLEAYIERLPKELIYEEFKEMFDFMSNKEQAECLIELIGLNGESLYDSFAEGTHSMKKSYKSKVALLMILENMRDA